MAKNWPKIYQVPIPLQRWQLPVSQRWRGGRFSAVFHSNLQAAASKRALPSGYVKIAMENDFFCCGFSMIFPLIMMIFHSYVKLPEGTHHSSSFCYLIIPHLHTQRSLQVKVGWTRGFPLHGGWPGSMGRNGNCSWMPWNDIHTIINTHTQTSYNTYIVRVIYRHIGYIYIIWSK